MIGRIAGNALLLSLLLGQAGCRKAAKAPASPPPPAVSTQPMQMPPPPQPAPRPIEEPPLPSPSMPVPPQPEPTVITPNVITPPPPPKSGKQSPARRPRSSQRTPAEVKPQEDATTAPQPQEASPGPASLPTLGEVIPGAETRRLERSMADNLSVARSSLASLKGRKLTREQSENATRIRAFVSRAEKVGKNDIAAAAELARRAALLADDLLKTLQ